MEGLGMNPDFWRGKRVFLTGHTGFKGAWLSLWLHSLGAEVYGYALAPATSPALFSVAIQGVNHDMISKIGDVVDAENLKAAINSAKPEIVFHLAAQSLVRPSYDDPVGTYATNVMGTVHLLESVRQTSGVKAVVVITSDKCYENREWVWGYRENDPMGGYDPYSNSKGCAELVSAAYRSSFFSSGRYSEHGVALATARAGNVIGGGDWAKDRLIPDLIRAFADGRVVEIRNPKAIRPWQHVLEPLHGYLMLAEALYQRGPEFAEGWNFGPDEGDARPVEWIADRMTSHWEGTQWMLAAGDHPHEAGFLRLDTSKARSSLGWRPKLRLDEALSMTVDWYRAVHGGADARAWCLAQIADYQIKIATATAESDRINRAN
jgi:CDP-glucose 4,6-dehydratase